MYSRSTEVLYGESSMRNGFGLRLLHKFLGLPFLRLQKETLNALMERNQRDTDICSFELSEYLVINLIILGIVFLLFTYCILKF